MKKVYFATPVNGRRELSMMDKKRGALYRCLKVREQLIEIFTDKGDVVIDPCAGSGTTLLAAMNKMRRAYGFEIKKDFYKDATEKVLRVFQPKLF